MSKGGTTSQSTQIPAWLENAAIENINKGRDVSQIGYTPYYGPDVAAFSPMQQQSMRSTGNAASAFGLAPQGFDAMAGMPQAQTFAGGLQGYSSAPLYEQSLDKLFANAPAQYRAINDMFIDPFTGASPRNRYGATPAQTQQMISGGGGDGGGGAVSVSRDGNNDGEYFGVNNEYNPYKYSMPTKDISGDGVIDYRDMSFGEAGRRDIGFGEKLGDMIKGVTGISAIEGMIDYGQGIADGFTPSPFDNGLFSQTSGSSMTPEESMRIINEGADRYSRLSNDRGFTPNSLGSIGGGLSDDMLRDDIYSSGGLLGNSPYQRELDSGSRFAQARMQEDIRAAQEAADFAAKNAAFVAKQEADLIKLNQLNNAVAADAAKKAADAAAAKAAQVKRRNDRGPEARQTDAKGNATKGGAVTSRTTGKNTTGKSF